VVAVVVAVLADTTTMAEAKQVAPEHLDKDLAVAQWAVHIIVVAVVAQVAQAQAATVVRMVAQA
jgi:hypothetical protein